MLLSFMCMPRMQFDLQCATPRRHHCTAQAPEVSSQSGNVTSLHVQEKVGRINLMHADVPYAALWEEDPVPPREHLLYVSGLPAGSRIGDIAPQLEKAGLGRTRLHFRSGGAQVGRPEL